MDNLGRGNAAEEDGGRNKEAVNLDNSAEKFFMGFCVFYGVHSSA